jgi:polysaccharide deacetylase family protein (PEP-CTERM system associated)
MSTLHPADAPPRASRTAASDAKTSSNETAGLPNAFTVDVEDYYQVTSFEKDIPRSHWDRMKSRVVGSTHRLLHLMERHRVRGTFFILGWVADRHPQLVRDIADRGHEIGSHSYWHRLVYELTPEEFREDLCRSRDVLEEITGQRVTAYRAPTFSITEKSLWALDILAEEGFEIDSSIFPVYHDRYGVAGAPREIHTIETESGPLTEFPPTVIRCGRLNIPVGGGGYFRLYPFALTRAGLKRCNDRPFMFYTHPWEVDSEQPRLKVASRSSRFRHYVNLSTTEGKLERLFESFPFAPMREILSQV